MREMAELRLQQAKEERRIAQAEAADRESRQEMPDWRELAARPLDPSLPTFDEMQAYSGGSGVCVPWTAYPAPATPVAQTMPGADASLAIMEMQQIEAVLNQYGNWLEKHNPQVLLELQMRLMSLRRMMPYFPAGL